MSFFSLFTLAFLVSSTLMICTWFFARAKNNFSVVDAVWAYSFGILAATFAILGNGFLHRRVLMFVCVAGWSFRLGSFLTRRIFSHHPKEDGRYAALRKEYGRKVESRFFWFFQYQAWSVVLLTLPFLIMALNPEPSISAVEWVGTTVFIFSVFGEATADSQMKEFKADPRNEGKTCDRGLWRYSRHPNYFFESCIWWGFYLMSLGSPRGAWMIYAPLIILFLLLKVTGVPMAEAQSLKSRGDEYRAYQKRTSVFFPWFPKVLVWVLVLVGTQSFADPLRARTAKIYPVGRSSGNPAFIQKTQYHEVKSGPYSGMTESKSTITDAQGKPVLTETAYFEGENLVSQKVMQFQTHHQYEMKNDGDRVFFYKRPLDEKDQPIKEFESHDRLPKQFVMGPTTEVFLARNWDRLMKGEAVTCQFGVMEIRDTLGFEFKLKGKTTINGKEVVQIEMKPTSFIVGLAIDAFQVYLDPKEKRFVKFVGRTPLLVERDGDLEPFDGEIIYQ